MITGTDLLEALPVAVYTTDADGRITFYNDAAAQMWGHRPELGSSRWCGSWRLYWPDGRPLPHDECPMAVTLREHRPVRGIEAVAERPDGTRVPFLPYPTPLKDASGRMIGAINLLVDISERKEADIHLARLAAIVESSDDAIISKNLDGRITSWNSGARRIFGYEAEEMIGEPIIRIIPPELHDEEFEILSKLRRGERVDHYETVRVAKDGRRIHVSLTVSPLRDRLGQVVGASKVSRDITERKQAEMLQRLLIDELNHRVKNMLATIQAIASQSLHRAASPGEFVSSFNGRVHALARAHDLLVQAKMKGADLMEIVREQVVFGTLDGARVSCVGPLLMLDSRVAVHLALVLHELATNARKHGALSAPTGRLSIKWELRTHPVSELVLDWEESGGPGVKAPTGRGFGTTLIERTLQGHGGEVSIRYRAEGVVCRIRLPLPEADGLAPASPAAPAQSDAAEIRGPNQEPDLRGMRVLIVEDEPLVSMEMEAQLTAAGCEVVGPAGNLQTAKLLVARERCDAALVDANLAGSPVDEVVSALAHRGVPFAFATGYGKEALPRGFEEAAILPKPFRGDQLVATVRALLKREQVGEKVVPLDRKRATPR